MIEMQAMRVHPSISSLVLFLLLLFFTFTFLSFKFSSRVFSSPVFYRCGGIGPQPLLNLTHREVPEKVCRDDFYLRLKSSESVVCPTVKI